ncbi:MAG: hypothetical protein F4Z71_14195 [Gammaproteobacteria bacterium]|nr:hypothetical protein [Gammaproteobacteria bacterium]MYE29418.1 hypothetical protein [Gammaproteobacteria bacterium]
MNTTRKNPFTPGYGQYPPYLAGREAEQNVVSEQVEAMADGDQNVNDKTNTRSCAGVSPRADAEKRYFEGVREPLMAGGLGW